MKKFKGFTLVEVTAMLLVLSIILAASAPLITKKIKAVTSIKSEHGAYLCYRNDSGQLVEEIYDGARQKSSNNVTECRFNPPAKATLFKIFLIGAGSGGSDYAKAESVNPSSNKEGQFILKSGYTNEDIRLPDNDLKKLIKPGTNVTLTFPDVDAYAQAGQTLRFEGLTPMNGYLYNVNLMCDKNKYPNYCINSSTPIYKDFQRAENNIQSHNDLSAILMSLINNGYILPTEKLIREYERQCANKVHSYYTDHNFQADHYFFDYDMNHKESWWFQQRYANNILSDPTISPEYPWNNSQCAGTNSATECNGYADGMVGWARLTAPNLETYVIGGDGGKFTFLNFSYNISDFTFDYADAIVKERNSYQANYYKGGTNPADPNVKPLSNVNLTKYKDEYLSSKRTQNINNKSTPNLNIAGEKEEAYDRPLVRNFNVLIGKKDGKGEDLDFYLAIVHDGKVTTNGRLENGKYYGPTGGKDATLEVGEMGDITVSSHHSLNENDNKYMSKTINGTRYEIMLKDPKTGKNMLNGLDGSGSPDKAKESIPGLNLKRQLLDRKHTVGKGGQAGTTVGPTYATNLGTHCNIKVPMGGKVNSLTGTFDADETIMVCKNEKGEQVRSDYALGGKGGYETTTKTYSWKYNQSNEPYITEEGGSKSKYFEMFNITGGNGALNFWHKFVQNETPGLPQYVGQGGKGARIEDRCTRPVGSFGYQYTVNGMASNSNWTTFYIDNEKSKNGCNTTPDAQDSNLNDNNGYKISPAQAGGGGGVIITW